VWCCFDGDVLDVRVEGVVPQLAVHESLHKVAAGENTVKAIIGQETVNRDIIGIEMNSMIV